MCFWCMICASCAAQQASLPDGGLARCCDRELSAEYRCYDENGSTDEFIASLEAQQAMEATALKGCGTAM
jgi:hypothetical protein